MRQFAAKGLRIWNLGREAKVIYSFFCILSIAAIASSVLLYEDLVGPTLRSGHLGRVGDYYSTTPGEASRADDPRRSVFEGIAASLMKVPLR